MDEEKKLDELWQAFAPKLLADYNAYMEGLTTQEAIAELSSPSQSPPSDEQISRIRNLVKEAVSRADLNEPFGVSLQPSLLTTASTVDKRIECEEESGQFSRITRTVRRARDGLFVMASWLEQLLGALEPQPQWAFQARTLRLEVILENLRLGLEPFDATALLDEKTNALYLEFFDSEGGVKGLPWQGRGVVLVSLGEMREEFPIDSECGSAYVKIRDIAPVAQVRFYLLNDNREMICELRIREQGNC